MPTPAQVWGYGSLATFITCLCSLIGAIILPCARKHKGVYNTILACFLGLAVATLAGGALIHLIPEALGAHGEEEEDEHHDEVEEHGVEPYIWYTLVAAASLYGFYILEMSMSVFKARNTAKVDNDSKSEVELNTLADDGDSGKSKKCYLVEPIVVMIIFGDGIHNFADGLAIAASFNASIPLGVSTSIAVFCHEVPHELGDFAILLKSGMRVRTALFLNFLSSLTAMAGFFIGVPISQNDTAQKWIFAITAGFFLYISLTDMLPEIIKDGSKSLKVLFFHNFGMYVGIAISVLLAVYEEKISV